MSVHLTSIHIHIILIQLKCNMFVRVLQLENEKKQVRNVHSIDYIPFDDYRKACRSK